jgi:hypothetical protein
LLHALNVTVTTTLPLPLPPEVINSQGSLEAAVHGVTGQAPPGVTVKEPDTVTGVLPSAGTALVRGTVCGVTVNGQPGVTIRKTVTVTELGIDGEEIVKFPV